MPKKGAVLSLPPSTPGSAMTGLSSISSSEPLRTISDRVGGAGSSTSSELSALSISSEDGGIIVAKGPARRSSVGGQTKGKRPRESEASDAPAKKLKSDGEQVERGIYCHQPEKERSRAVGQALVTPARDSPIVISSGDDSVSSEHSALSISDESELSALSELEGSADPMDSLNKVAETAPKSKAKPKPRLSTGSTKQAKTKPTKGSVGGSSKATPKAKAKSTPGKATPAKKPTPGKKATPGKATPAKVTPGKKATPGKDKPKAASKKGANAKSSAKAAPKPKPAKKPTIVEPPVFEKLDTKLSLDEAEQRIQVSVPWYRSMFALDDFDRPLTEASVRLFAGAMLEAIKLEVEKGGDDELRYYADTARFAFIYNELAEPLSLRLPKPVDHDATLRAILAIADDQPTPSWALETGPARRTAASRVPTSAEVVRMLLALAERTLATPRFRASLDSMTSENASRRSHAIRMKSLTNRHEAKQKGFAEARLRIKNATDAKWNKEFTIAAREDYEEQAALLNVNLRAILGRTAPRSGPLGIDVDGRVYYALSHRLVEDGARPPSGWASGLLVYGAVPRKEESDELSETVPRWSHFGKPAPVRQLAKWVEWRAKQAADAAKPAFKSPKKTPSKTTGGQLKLSFTPKKSMSVVIPKQADDNVSSSSSLTAESSDDLQALLHPPGYKPSPATIEENGKELARRLIEVAEWLMVMEVKGMGEVN
ncbi:hypothetical protein EHS25_003115 [Saitozyma podzolica]|uniref:Uncharacterized protein n=1 Tax=Saitozyma podzolica TaxID=1890683 RepID=A0A427Y7Z6_9TREE|nr:hypothetical protein EHS25_003115 [Saitozyma podzolica]